MILGQTPTNVVFFSQAGQMMNWKKGGAARRAEEEEYNQGEAVVNDRADMVQLCRWRGGTAQVDS